MPGNRYSSDIPKRCGLATMEALKAKELTYYNETGRQQNGNVAAKNPIQLE